LAGVNRRKLFKRRTVHSLVILGSVAYLQFMLRSLQGLSCHSRDGTPRSAVVRAGSSQRVRFAAGVSVLRIEETTECYTGAHIGTAYACCP
jgi:hypothetical protein